MTDKAQAKTSELVTVRDTVESIWVAIVLAFVLRAFMVEAFVIPTGSMAPRLMGEHWDLVCPACAYEYAFGAPKPDEKQPLNRNLPSIPAGSARCPNCGRIYGDAPSGPPSYINSGDRVLVLKYLYNFRDPRPWDVVVFRNPQNNRENYIKRLIGLPGETIQIVHGDVWVQNPQWSLDPQGDSADGVWHIRRKGQQAQEAMWQVVFDDDCPPNPRQPHDAREWKPVEGGRAAAWDLSGAATAGGRRFIFTGGLNADEFRQLEFSAPASVFLPRYGYNQPSEEAKDFDSSDMVSDLKLSLTFVPQQADSQVRLETSSFEHHFRADLKADGTASLWHMLSGKTSGKWEQWGQPVKLPPLELNKGHELALTHVDMRASFNVDGREVLASTSEEYPADYDAVNRRLDQMKGGDPVPIPAPQVRLAAGGGPSQLWHVKLMRDVYYTCPLSLEKIPDGPLGEYALALKTPPKPAWGCRGNPIKLEADSFFVLGDNSPQSLDGRRWTSAAPTLRLWKNPAGPFDAGNQLYQLGTVPGYNLIGKALFVYWPSGFRPPGMPGIPIIPNVGKMRLIR